MKATIKFFGVLLALFVSSVIFAKQTSAQASYVSFQVFYDQLNPYGQWIDNPDYGYVWIPDAEQDFAPYSSAGHWLMTDYGLTWVSDYNWGWAPFHYGRWDYDNSFGWFWVPGNEWGPAWVTWRRASGYYGWEPMQPGVSISVSFGSGYNSQYDHWMFVRDRDIDRSDLKRYYINRTDHDRIIRSSTVINNTYVDSRRNTTYVSGPAREDIQKVTGRRINPVVIQENDRPGQNVSNGRLQIYRPQVMKNNDNQQKPVPSRITNLKDVRQPAGRSSANQSQNINQARNNRPVQQSNRVNQQNNNNNNVNPTGNNKPVQQSNRVNQQNTNNNIKPTGSNRPVQQPNTVNQQNNNNRATSLQQQKTISSKNKKAQQTKTVKPSTKSKTVQPDKPKSEQNKGKID
jgi:hypothetical protein